MAATAMTIGESVKCVSNHKATNWQRATTIIRYGTVIEIGDGMNSGRVRVLWGQFEVFIDGKRTKDGHDSKRTWMATDKLLSAS
jgi:hypothetical protein